MTDLEATIRRMVDQHEEAAEARAQMLRGPDPRSPDQQLRDTQIILLNGSLDGVKAALFELARAIDRLETR